MRKMYSLFGGGVPKLDKQTDRLVCQRLAALGYYDEGDDSGSGSALDGILSAASTLGAAYIVSQNQPQTTQIPTRTNPAYGAATPFLSSGGTTGGGGLLLFGVVILAVVGLFFAFK